MMKNSLKYFFRCLIVILSFNLIGCQQNIKNATTSDLQTSIHEKNENDVLVAYFSQSGNTKKMAEFIANYTNGTLLEIKPVTPYPNNYSTILQIAKV